VSGTVATCAAIRVAKHYFIFRTMESKCIKLNRACLAVWQAVDRCSHQEVCDSKKDFTAIYLRNGNNFYVDIIKYY